MNIKLKKTAIDIFRLLKVSVIESVDDNILKFAAALAYYTVFSLVPMLIIVLWVSAIFYDASKVQGELLAQMNEILGADAVKQIQQVMINTKFDHGSDWAKILGVITLIFTATGIFGEIQDSINTIWGLKTKPERGFIKLLLNRLLSFSMIVSLGFILVISLVINAVIAFLTSGIHGQFPGIPVWAFYVVDQIVIFCVIVFLFGAVFKVLPDAKIHWKDVIAGAVITAFFFMGGKYLIGYYLGENATISAYGSAGSVIIILLWVYYSSIILYFGAEFTQAYLKLKGRHVEPNQYAVWVEEKEKVVSSNTVIHKENITQ